MSANSVSLEGYDFQLKGYCSSKGKTTVIVGVSGNGSSAAALTGWILGISPANKNNDLNILSCEKRKGNGPWVAAMAANTAYELIGDAGISGAIIEERVEGGADDAEAEFRLTVEGEHDPLTIRVAYISGDDVFVSQSVLTIDPPSRIWLTPIEKSFCLYIVVSDGYRPEPLKANVSITKKGAFLAHEKGSFKAEGERISTAMPVKSSIVGSIKVVASVPLNNSAASGDTVEAGACGCFELCETIAYTNEDETVDIRDISIYPDRKSFDTTLLNSRCGKSVYRLDGEFIIDCIKC